MTNLKADRRANNQFLISQRPLHREDGCSVSNEGRILFLMFVLVSINPVDLEGISEMLAGMEACYLGGSVLRVSVLQSHIRKPYFGPGNNNFYFGRKQEPTQLSRQLKKDKRDRTIARRRHSVTTNFDLVATEDSFYPHLLRILNSSIAHFAVLYCDLSSSEIAILVRGYVSSRCQK